MRKALLCAAALLVLSSAAYAQTLTPTGMTPIKSRLDHFSGTDRILVISYLPAEITSITCEKWTMLGPIGSWKGHNPFTIPAGPSVAVMDASGFDGYCKGAGSIRAHTDEGDYVGALDRGDGNWSGSTKLTFSGQK